MSSSEAGRRPVLGGVNAEIQEIQRTLHTSLWYKNFRLILFVLLGLQAMAIILLILTTFDMVNVRLPAYGKARANPIFSGLENTSYASYLKETDYVRWAIPLLFAIVAFLHIRVYAAAMDEELLAPLNELKDRLKELKQQPALPDPPGIEIPEGWGPADCSDFVE